MRLLKTALSAAGLWALAAIPAQAADPAYFALDNGLEVVVIEDPRAPVVVNMVWYRVGAADDPAGQSGIAHYLEHLMFKATDTLATGEFSDIVEANGGRDNAFTSWDYTGYHQRIAADRLELMIRNEADRMVNLRLDLSDWLPEREVVLRERGQTMESNPDRQFGEQMRAALFQNHPYGRPIIGWRHEMETLDDQIATDFYRRFYAPNNAILVVAGDVEAEDVLAMAQTHFGPIPRFEGLQPRTRPIEPPHLAERRITMQDARVAQPYVNRLYLAPARRSGDQRQAAALQLLGFILGGSAQTSVLERSLTYDQGLTLTAWAGYNGLALDHGTFSLGAMPAAGVTLQQAEDALDAAIAAFIETGVDAEQLERVRQQVRASSVYELDSASERANAIGAALSIGLTLQDVDEWRVLLETITAEEIVDAARSLDRTDSVTGWLMGEQQ